ncbi:MAG: DUF4433 domain-containing protein [Tannerellaceae bacterium]|nr:DUF4433 domain-containing protein [Tannerellaceae bacterium]
MKYVAEKQGRIQDAVVLWIDTEVAYWQHTRFSDMNATKTGHNEGPELHDLEMVNFDVVNELTYFDVEREDRDYYQAEMLVKTWVPIKYIWNINEFK